MNHTLKIHLLNQLHYRVSRKNWQKTKARAKIFAQHNFLLSFADIHDRLSLQRSCKRPQESDDCHQSTGQWRLELSSSPKSTVSSSSCSSQNVSFLSSQFWKHSVSTKPYLYHILVLVLLAIAQCAGKNLNYWNVQFPTNFIIVRPHTNLMEFWSLFAKRHENDFSRVSSQLGLFFLQSLWPPRIFKDYLTLVQVPSLVAVRKQDWNLAWKLLFSK